MTLGRAVGGTGCTAIPGVSPAQLTSKPTVVLCTQVEIVHPYHAARRCRREARPSGPSPAGGGSLAPVSVSVGADTRATLAFCPPLASDIQ